MFHESKKPYSGMSVHVYMVYVLLESKSPVSSVGNSIGIQGILRQSIGHNREGYIRSPCPPVKAAF